MPAYYSRRGVVPDIVEKYSAAIAHVKEYITGPLENGGSKLFAAEAFKFVMRGRLKTKRKRYHIVVHDVFAGGEDALPLVRADVFAKLASNFMTKTGVLVVNFLGATNPRPRGGAGRTTDAGQQGRQDGDREERAPEGRQGWRRERRRQGRRRQGRRRQRWRQGRPGGGARQGQGR